MTELPERLLAAARERFALQDYHGAIHCGEQIVAQGRAFADVHHLLGLSWALLDFPERALAEFDRALGLNPRYLEAHIHRGLALVALGRADEAGAAFRRAGEVTPPAVGRLSATAAARLANMHADLAQTYADAGDRERAVAEYRRALELGPTFHDLRYRLARLLLEGGRALEAREELTLVVRELPDFIDARAALGLAHFISGDAATARDVWETCRRAGPSNTRVQAYLAMVERGVET